MAVDLLLLLGEGRRREPRRLAAEVLIALLLLEEGRRHEPRGLAAVPLVLLLLGEGRRHAPCELAVEVRRLFCWCWERDDDAAPGGALLHGEVRRHLAGVCRHGEAGRCPPGRPCRRCPPQHTPPSAAVPAVSPRLCFLGTVAVGRGRRVSSERLPYGQ